MNEKTSKLLMSGSITLGWDLKEMKAGWYALPWRKRAGARRQLKAMIRRKQAVEGRE